jgi:hypothetical protein
MKKILILTKLFLFLFTMAPLAQQSKNAQRPEVGKYCKVYVDNENLQITMVRVGDRENNEILFEVIGIDHPFDKKIFKAKVTEVDDRTNITIKYEGKDWIIASKKSGDIGYDNYVVYLPNKGKKYSEFIITYSKELSNNCKPEYLLTAYLEQTF